MSNTVTKRFAPLSFSVSNVSEPCLFVEIEQSDKGFAIGISGAASAIEIGPDGTVYVPGTLNAGTISGTSVPTTFAAHKVLAGPTSGSAAAPTARLLVASDIPDLSATYQPLSAINQPGGYSQLVSVPATASSAGAAGQIAYDSTHFYVCVATNTWVRATLATF